MGYDMGSPAQLTKMPETPEQGTSSSPFSPVPAPVDFCLVISNTCQPRRQGIWVSTSVLFFLPLLLQPIITPPHGLWSSAPRLLTLACLHPLPPKEPPQ